MCLFIRWLASGFSGVINATIWFGDEVFEKGMAYVYLASFIMYNLPYIAISGALCIIVGLATYRFLFLNENFVKKYEEE